MKHREKMNGEEPAKDEIEIDEVDEAYVAGNDIDKRAIPKKTVRHDYETDEQTVGAVEEEDEAE